MRAQTDRETHTEQHRCGLHREPITVTTRRGHRQQETPSAPDGHPSTVKDSLRVSGATAFTMCSSSVSGSLTVTGSTGPVSIGGSTCRTPSQGRWRSQASPRGELHLQHRERVRDHYQLHRRLRGYVHSGQTSALGCVRDCPGIREVFRPEPIDGLMATKHHAGPTSAGRPCRVLQSIVRLTTHDQ